MRIGTEKLVVIVVRGVTSTMKQDAKRAARDEGYRSLAPWIRRLINDKVKEYKKKKEVA